MNPEPTAEQVERANAVGMERIEAAAEAVHDMLHASDFSPLTSWGDVALVALEAADRVAAVGVQDPEAPDREKMVLEEALTLACERVAAERERSEALAAGLLHYWRYETCPCGARRESPSTHSHVIGCPVGHAFAVWVASEDQTTPPSEVES